MVYASKAHRCLSMILSEASRLDKPEAWRLARIFDIVDNYYENQARGFYVQKKESERQEEGDEKGTPGS